MCFRVGGMLVAMLISASVWAAPIDDAKVAFASGKEAFERGEYESALTAFLKADRLAPAPNLTYNIGNTYERIGRYTDAATSFERYLGQAGPPTSEEEKQFQENLRARIAANRKRSELNAAQSAPPVLNAPYQTLPNYYPSFQTPQAFREMKRKELRGRRGRAIALMAIGASLQVIGIVPLALAASEHDSLTLGVEDFFGVSLEIVGLTLWIPGAVSFARSERELKELSAQPTPRAELPSPPMGGQPHAMIFHLPTIRF